MLAFCRYLVNSLSIKSESKLISFFVIVICFYIQMFYNTKQIKFLNLIITYLHFLTDLTDVEKILFMNITWFSTMWINNRNKFKINNIILTKLLIDI
jgi:hypothetical protein